MSWLSEAIKDVFTHDPFSGIAKTIAKPIAEKMITSIFYSPSEKRKAILAAQPEAFGET